MSAVLSLDLQQIHHWLDAQARAAARPDISKPLKVIRVLVIAEQKEHFARGEAPDGTPWLPLKRPRRRPRDRRKSRRAGTDKPLRDTGLLMASVSARGVNTIDVMTATGLEFGSSLNYAGFHQHGTRHIPARPFLGLSDQLIERAGQIVGEHLTRMPMKGS